MANKNFWSKRWYIKRGATNPSLTLQIIKEDTNEPLNIAGATVKFTMKRIGATNPILDEVNGEVVDNAQGLISYSWDSSPVLGTELAGKFLAEFSVTLINGDVIKQPQNGYIEIYVLEDLS